MPEAIDLSLAAGNDSALEDAEAWRKLSVSAHEALEWRTARYETTPLGKLSPGCALRAYLAVALHRRSIEVLLLDEPTNHLDLPSILWLERSILAAGKSVVVVSHDAAFLDNVCDHLWEIDTHEKTLTVSGSSYSNFRREKQLAKEQQEAAYEQQQQRHKRLTESANKLKAASAKGQRAVAKDHDKLQRDFRRDRAGRSGRKAKAIEKARDSEEKVERVVHHDVLKIEIDSLGAGADSTLILQDVLIGCTGGIPLPLPPLSLRVDFGERVAIVGYNGIGKSTLLRTLTRAIEPLSGSVTLGRELRVGHLMQEHESLPRDQSARKYFSELSGIAEFDTGKRLINYGLTLQQVDGAMGTINPGARARAILAGFAMRRVNCLILDEPTNHLDVEAIEEVLVSLHGYKGTVVVVSHNRNFLAELNCSRMLLLSPNGLEEVESLEAFVGDIDDLVADVVMKWQSRR